MNTGPLPPAGSAATAGRSTPGATVRPPCDRGRAHRLVGAGVVVGCVVLIALSVVDAGGVVATLQAAGPLLGSALLLVGLVVFGVLRWVWPGAALLVTAAVLLAPMGLTHVAPTSSGATGPRLTVLTFNSFVGRSSAERLVEVIDRVDPDVLVLIEATPSHWNSLQRHGLGARLAHVTGRLGPGGMVIVSKEHHTCPELPDGVACGTITHRPMNTRTTEDETRPYFDMATVRLANGMDLRAVHAWSIRMKPYGRWHRQQEDLVAWKERRLRDASGRPFVMAGDFNAGFSHPVFRRLASGLDHAPAGEWPWPRTWSPGPSIPMLVQVDHLLSSGVDVLDSGVEPVPGGDHAAVRATYAIRSR